MSSLTSGGVSLLEAATTTVSLCRCVVEVVVFTGPGKVTGVQVSVRTPRESEIVCEVKKICHNDEWSTSSESLCEKCVVVTGQAMVAEERMNAVDVHGCAAFIV